MVNYDLPLLTLFTRLRQAGLPLGIDEYQLLLRALQGGFGLRDRASLAWLCKTLWIKSLEEERLFNYHFEQLVPLSFTSESTSTDSQPSTQTTTASATSTPNTVPSSNAPAPVSGTTSPPSLAATSELSLKVEDEVQVAKAILHTTSRDEVIVNDYFMRTDEYFPITARQMKQSWRYLRSPIREGPPTELDVETTVNKVARQGILLEPVLVPRRRNRVELLLLIDQDGSMSPFHALSRRLAETALRGGRLGKTHIYYFHNCPVEHLYQHPVEQKAKSIQTILDRLDRNRVCTLVFSDAGAARGSFNLERAIATKKFLDRLKQHIRYVAWLNPMPYPRWLGTTAGEIMLFVPMFDLSRRGLDSAISVLRGRSISHLHNEITI